MKTRRTSLRCTELESRLTPADLSVAAPIGRAAYAVGPDAGDPGTVTVFRADGSVGLSGEPYGPGFTAGIRVALADVDGDGAPDLVTAPGPGAAPDVHVYSGRTGTLIGSFGAFEGSFLGGVYVGAADLTGDGRAEVIAAPDQGGGPRVRVLDGAALAAGQGARTVADFLALDDPNFRGGVRVALGDVTGDGTADLVAGAGFGGGPRVTGYEGAALGRGERVKLFGDFFAFEPGLRNGVYVAVGDVTGDGAGELIFGGGPGGGPRVRVLDGAARAAGYADPDAATVANFFAGDPNGRLGARVGVVPAGPTTVSVVAADASAHSARVYGRDGTPGGALGTPAGLAGVNVAGAPFDRVAYNRTPTPAAPTAGSAGSADGGSPTTGGVGNSTSDDVWDDGGSSGGGSSDGGSVWDGGDSSGGDTGGDTSGGGSTGDGGGTPSFDTDFPSDANLRAALTTYFDVNGNENELAATTDPLGFATWTFYSFSGEFFVNDLSGNVLAAGYWRRNGDGSIRYSTTDNAGNPFVSGNRVEVSGTAYVTAEALPFRQVDYTNNPFDGPRVVVVPAGSLIVSGSFYTNASLFSIFGSTFGQFASAMRYE